MSPPLPPWDHQGTRRTHCGGLGVGTPLPNTPPWLHLGPPAQSLAGDMDLLGRGMWDQDPCELGMAGGTDCAMGNTGATAAGEQGRGVRTKAPPGVRAWAQPPCPSCSAHGHRSSQGAHLGCACPPGPSSPEPPGAVGGLACPPLWGPGVLLAAAFPQQGQTPPSSFLSSPGFQVGLGDIGF